ncbi:DUF402 domain-containing protein [Beutenbergia cavernae]|uniref:DUF402 domain-containing protein n=1 Tax=Beutenbergia cavernae TaxID=84757 RepID=UPI001C9D7DED|nr:DUF402 domain-containing protein [Beutenbergia cavernae]
MRYTKYDGGAHWALDARLLGEDDAGTWVFMPRGTVQVRPGVSFEAAADAVGLFPHDQPWVAWFSTPVDALRPISHQTYVDVSTVPVWTADGREVTMVDLDLDVIAPFDGEPFVDDEDEFAEHRVRYGYPDDVVALAERSAEDVLAAVRTGAEPFGSAWRPWLDGALAR